MSPIFIVIFIAVMNGGSCAPVEPDEAVGEPTSVKEKPQDEINERNLADTPQTNPVQQWFQDASKNFSSNAQNTMNNLENWFSKVAQAASNMQQNTPTMYLGSFQLVKMPMPQIGDAIKGMGDLATFAQNVNKLTGGNLPLTQNLPLLSQG